MKIKKTIFATAFLLISGLFSVQANNKSMIEDQAICADVTFDCGITGHICGWGGRWLYRPI